MKPAKILVNWYKTSGKWYAREEMYIPYDVETWDNQHVEYVETNQKELQKSFVNGNWFMTISCIEQDEDDNRFFERFIKYPRIN